MDLNGGKMKDGLPHGEMKVFNEKGKVTSILNYKNGVLDSVSKGLDENGELVKEIFNKDVEK